MAVQLKRRNQEKIKKEKLNLAKKIYDLIIRMSFNRLPYDTCAYKQVLAETVGPGVYQLSTPPNTCDPCHTTDPYIRLQSSGASISRNTPLVDIDSELLGITRNLTECPERKYLPDINADGLCGANIGGSVGCQKSAKLCVDHTKNPIRYNNCFESTEDTRLSNPPCTLRGTGWNRWEWLCQNPQDKVEIPYDFEISSRTLAKDNHRPCIPRPLDQYAVYPEESDEPICDNIVKVCGVPTGPPSVQWRNTDEIRQY
jgi:hypothetical protein